MQTVFHLFAAVFAKVPYPVRSLLSFLTLPIFIIVLMINFIREMDFKGMSIQGMAFADLKKQLKIEEATGDESAAEKAAVVQQARDWLEVGDWQALDATLTKMDRDGVKAADGSHLSKEVMGAVWAHVTQGIPSRRDECGQTLMEPVPFERVEPFIEAVKKYPNSAVINSLAAWLCIEIGWTYRGGDYADYVSEGQFEKMNWMFQTADNFLNRFDARTAGSPMLARIRYHRTAGIDTTLEELKAAFATCMRLDPDDTNMMSTHAFHLLPRWYGSYEILEDEARRAHARTHLERGATDYAAFYIDQIDLDDGALATVDMALFDQGLRDWVAWSETPQETLNMLLGKLNRAAMGTSGFVATPAIVKRRRKDIHAIFDGLVREDLKVAMVDRWGSSRKEMYYSVARAFVSELNAGETVRIGSPAVS